MTPMTERGANSLKLLLVDDDDVDIRGVRRKLRDLALDLPLTVAYDGEEALSILRGGDGNPPFAEPYVIMLDLNMPRMNGLEFLAELRRDPRLKRAIVFVFSTSEAAEDIRKAYDLNVAGYVHKSESQHSLAEFLVMISEYCHIVRLPA